MNNDTYLQKFSQKATILKIQPAWLELRTISIRASTVLKIGRNFPSHKHQCEYDHVHVREQSYDLEKPQRDNWPTVLLIIF